MTLDFYDYTQEQLIALFRRGMVLTYNSTYKLYADAQGTPVYDDTERKGTLLYASMVVACNKRSHLVCDVVHFPSLYRRTKCK